MTTFEEEVARVRKMGIEVDRPVKEHDGWQFGERVRVIEDDEPHGMYASDEGILVIEEVGSAEHGNVRTAVCILIDDTDCPMEADLFNIEGA